MDKILVLNFGGQYDQLIARRIRALHVFAEIRNYNKITPDEIRQAGYRGVVFTGGPHSVYADDAPRCSAAVLSLGIPVLGICYGHQLLAFLAGGAVMPAESGSEYGRT
ncbi:MAG: GMP synthase (glutamine-hydrolyzing), partial [Clostridia bacterium]|nr:GMP synthase (glutamine-hydrolyzing) [Clostridia bacterium]